MSIPKRYVMSIGLSLIAFVIVIILGLLFPDYFREWEEKILDYRLRLNRSVPESPYIAPHVGVDDISMDEIGHWPWDRAYQGRMISLLSSMGTSVINLDLMFPREASEEGDSQFIQAVEDAGNVILSAPFNLIDHPCFTRDEYEDFLARFPQAKTILNPPENEQGNICIDLGTITDNQAEQLGDEAYFELYMHDPFVYTGEDDKRRVEVMLEHFEYPFTLQEPGQLLYGNRTTAPMEGLSSAALGLGHISATPDSDGVFRRVPLVIRVQEQLFPSLAFAGVLTYLDVAPQDVILVPGKHIVIPNAKFPKSSTRTEIRIPVDERLQLRINYPLKTSGHSFSEILTFEGYAPLYPLELRHSFLETWKTKFEDRICTIGYITTGTGDIGPTPLGTGYFLAFIHTAIANTILTQNFLYDTGWGINFGITLLLVLFLSAIFPRLSPLRFTLVLVVTIMGYMSFITVLLNVYGIVLKLIHPTLSSLILSYALIIVYWYATEERERKHLRSAFKTYVSRQMLDQILDNPGSLALTGQRKELTIMFSDVRKFSTLSDKIEPEVIHKLLNLYFDQMTKIAFKYDGFVDKFIGDGLLCFFGDPIAHPDHALRAVRAAIEMQRAIRKLGPEIQEQLGIDPIVVRIGLNTGHVIVGNMGSAERMEYTVLGSDVNLAQRLESSATPGEIMISQKTYEHIGDEIQTRDMGEINVKGFERPIKVYEIELPFE